MFIASQEQLEAFARRAAKSEVLAIDTEFMREKTYYPRLCLLQLGIDGDVAIVDPFAVEDLGVLADVLRSASTVKLFHSGRQDLEIILREVGVMPRPLFDTQVAAALLGHTQQIGYGALVHAVCGVTLKKADSYTDWSARPLAPSQVDYAADDVRYLPQLYRSMSETLREKGRLSWLEREFEDMSDPARYEVDVYERYRHLKRVNQLSRRQLAAAREFAAWREERAQKRDLPRKWVLSDEQIVEACRREPRTIDELYMVRGMREHVPVRDAREVVRRMAAAMDAPESSWPASERSGRNEPNVDAQLDLMAALVRLRAKENDVAIPTLASHDDLVRVARGYRDGVEVLRGWRRAIVGEELLELLDGRLSLRLAGSELVVERVERVER